MKAVFINGATGKNNTTEVKLEKFVELIEFKNLIKSKQHYQVTRTSKTLKQDTQARYSNTIQ